ncbi:hypothetical protein A3742_15135 [Oleiphilus sp. HI0071]|mgnify:CR=1 FL=1|uniref:OmpA/MotB family protein n=1 Tax=Oleiphilus sp. HI0080 TaxID=1822255 RepID=UPI0007C336B3|nr:OmpA family protein [Oleiphilus sp. HI0080]KZY60157.1 hypothetical protein A3737_07000 [Oleiphilus sp. HI0065]KZY78478.1 hypothetical protein A3742_15135 [Oleiphilus sp. HI0071]KZY90126.1 hypothetical protein A3744_05765 [Oleiphilus sp. HI0073]KZZ49643.1 hypothetical protein A3760_14705 [Oleiphilus sp. HI0122]KZY92161.1 hypothetical protein A3744_19685 [Oleiphilus sp. HI0073]
MNPRAAQASADRDIDETGSWLSIGDLMSGLLMLFAVLLIATLTLINENQDQRIIIIQTLKETLENADFEVEVNPKTGDISILDSVLFKPNQSAVTQAGKEFLASFVPTYSKALLADPIVAEQISYIIIEGHSDSLGPIIYNMNLSIDRAKSVFNEVSEIDISERGELIARLLVAGRGEADSYQAYQRKQDRKVVFRIQFKNEKFWAQLKDILSMNKD